MTCQLCIVHVCCDLRQPTAVQLSSKIKQASHGMAKSEHPHAGQTDGLPTVPGNDAETGRTLSPAVSVTSHSALDPSTDAAAAGGGAAVASNQIQTVSDLASAAGVHFRLKQKNSSIDMLLYRMFEEEMKMETGDEQEIYKLFDSDEEGEEDEGDDEELALSYYHAQIKNTYRRSQVGLNTLDGSGEEAHTDYQIWVFENLIEHQTH